MVQIQRMRMAMRIAVGQLWQETNAFSSPLPIEQLGIAGREAARVWRNVPPAQIWAYTPDAGGALERMP